MNLKLSLTLASLMTFGASALIPLLDNILEMELSSSGHKAVAKDKTEIPGGSPIFNCDSEQTQLIEINSVVLDPNPPVPGENLTITANAHLKKAITDGAYVDVIVKYGFIILVNKRYDLCEVLPEADLQCPVESGDMLLTRTLELPNEIPPGEYIVSARAYTAEDELLTCLFADTVMG